MKGIATLQVGSALGSSILGILLALAHLRKAGSATVLTVNINGASTPARFFFKNYHLNPSLIEIIDLPTKVRSIHGQDQPATDDFDGEELFYSPPILRYHETDFELVSSIMQAFWEGVTPPTQVEAVDVCMHIRRGDKLIFESFKKVNSLDEYASYLEDHVQPLGIVCIITDDHNTFLAFRKLRPGWEVRTTSSPANAGFNIMEINQAPESVVGREVAHMMEDFERIRRARFFLGTQYSNVGRLGLLLRGGRDAFLLS